MIAQKHEAIVLAEWIESDPLGDADLRCAVLLRRIPELETENARLLAARDDYVEGHRRLSASNAQLLDALKAVTTAKDVVAYGAALHDARAVITKVQGGAGAHNEPPLHSKIMNIQIDTKKLSGLASDVERAIYKIGHRDACHAAAELISESAATSDVETHHIELKMTKN